MNDLRLEPLPDDVAQALGQLAAPPSLPPGVAEAVLLKVKASAGLAAVAGAASSGAGASAVAKGGASVLLKVLPVVTLTAGLGLGIAVDRLVLRPSTVERVIVVERVNEAAELPSHVVTPPPALVPQKKQPKPDTLGKERVLLDVARSAVNAREWAKALSAVASHEANFPSGQLVEEREALAIQALLGAGQRTEARRRVSAFTTRFPDSPLRTSLETMVQ